jgi:hypothetical protein
MSLTYLLKSDRGRSNLKKWFRHHFPNPGLDEALPILVAPKQPDAPYASEVGTAFDYVLRFALERLNQETLTAQRPWVATRGLARILRMMAAQKLKHMKVGYVWEKKVHIVKFKSFILSEYEKAKQNHQQFLVSGELTDALLRSALILAKLDVTARTMFIDAKFEEIEDDKVAELRELFGVVPWEQFQAQRLCTLNPTFGSGSKLVGGADADVIIDHTLIDIKTTKALTIEREGLSQVVGYYLLSLIGEVDSGVESVGIYFARHGYLWRKPLTDYYALSEFPGLAEELRQLVDDDKVQLVPTERKQALQSVPSTKRRAKKPKPVVEYSIDEHDFKCPFCQSTDFNSLRRNGSLYRYRCESCSKVFTSHIQGFSAEGAARLFKFLEF